MTTFPAWPRCMSRTTASAYLDMSPSHFDRLVQEGVMPKPRVVGKKKVLWDAAELDLAIKNLPKQDDEWKENFKGG